MMNFVPPTAARVPKHTAAHINRQIEQQIEASVVYFAGHRDEIDRRLEELDQEWDIERTLEANAAGFSLLGLTLAMTLDRRWLALPVGVAAFLLQHAVQGWCPPVPVFRRLGVRTAGEIDQERYALKALRGDFDRRHRRRRCARPCTARARGRASGLICRGIPSLPVVLKLVSRNRPAVGQSHPGSEIARRKSSRRPADHGRSSKCR